MPPQLRPTRNRNALTVAETKVGKSPVDKMVTDGGAFCVPGGQHVTFDLEEVMPHMGSPIYIDPGAAILDEIARSAGHVKWLEGKLVSMDEAEIVIQEHLIDEERSGGPGGGYSLRRRETRPEVSPWWSLYERERKHFATVCAAAVRAGIEERKIRIAERQADMLEAAFIAAVTELGLDPHSARVRQVIGKQLRLAIEGDIATPIDVINTKAERVPEPIERSKPTTPASGVAPVDF